MQYNAFCRSYKQIKTCINSCGYSAAYDEMKASFKVLDYMCIDRFDGKIAADISNNNLYVLLNIFNFSINLLFT